MRIGALAAAIAVVLCVAVAGRAYAAGMQEPDISWYTDDTGKSEYVLETPSQLRGLAELVNGTASDEGVPIPAVSFEDVVIKQAADFSLYDVLVPVEFTPIGTSEHPFAGTYDGNGSTIQGLHITTRTNDAGLFGYASETSEIRNVSIVSSMFAPSAVNVSTSTAKVENIGSVVGFTAGAVHDCSSTAEVVVESATTATKAQPYVVSNVGGLVGYGTGSISGCTFTGSLTASIETPSAKNTTESDDLRVADSFGGIVGRFGSPEVYGTLESSHNEGTIWVYTTGKGAADRFGTQTYARAFFIGGVCGYSNGSVVDCSNGSYNELATQATGLVSTSATDAADGSALDNRGGDQVAGVVGGLRSKSDDPERYNDGHPDHPVEVRNCFNKGIVTGCVSVGGVLGEGGSYTTITQSYNGIAGKNIPGNVTSTRWNKPISGGVVGRMWGGTVSYCANYGVVENIQTGYYMAGVCGAIWKSDDYPELEPELYGCLNTGMVLTANRSSTSEYREAGILGSNEGYAHDSIMLFGTVPYHEDAAIGDINWGQHSELHVMKQAEIQTAKSAAILNKTAAAEQDWDCYWFINSSGYPILNIWAGEGDRVELTSESIASIEMVKEAPYIGAGAEPIPEFSITLTNETELVQNTDFYVIPEPGASDMTGGELRYRASIVGIGMYRGTVPDCAPYAIGKGDLSTATVSVAEGKYNFGKVVFPTSVTATIAGHEVNADEYLYTIYDSVTGDVSGTAQKFAVYDSGGFVSFDNGANLEAVAGKDLNSETRAYTLYDRYYQKISDSEGRVYYVEGTGGVVGEPVHGRTSCINLKKGTPAGYTVKVEAESESTLLEGSAVGYYIIKTVNLHTDCLIDEVSWQDSTWYWDGEASVLYELDDQGERIEGVPAATFTGETIEPVPTVSFNGHVLTLGTDFRIVYGDPDPAQDAEDLEEEPDEADPNRNVTGDSVRAALTIRPVDTSSLSNYVIAYFGIEPADFADCDIVLASDEWAYTGSEVRPPVSVSLNGVQLVEGVDYDISYQDNVAKGQASYQVVPRENLSGGSLAPRGGTFNIVEGTDISSLSLEQVEDQPFNFGYDVHPDLAFKNGSMQVDLVENVDYTVSYSTTSITKHGVGDEAAPCVATIEGIGRYTGSTQASFHIVPFDASANPNGQLVATTQNLSFGMWGPGVKGVGAECPVVNVLAYPIVDWETLERGEPRTISATMNSSWGVISACVYRSDSGEVTYQTALPGPIEADITLALGSTGTRGGAVGTLRISFEYTTPSDIADAVEWRIDGNRTYDGTPRRPVVGVTKGGKVELKEGIDYTIVYTDNTAVGSAAFTVTALGGGYFTGEYSGSFSILPANLNQVATIDPIEDQVFKGVAITPPVTVRIGDVVLQQGVDYRVSYSGNEAFGTATVYVEGMGNCTGRISTQFELVTVKVSQIAGETRVETSVAAARAAYPNGCSGVIVATAWGYADALAASSLSGALDYPIMLTNSSYLDASVADAIRQLGATEAIVVGGTPSLSDGTKASIEAIIGKRATRLSGADRIGTQEAIYAFGAERGLWHGDPIIATAWSFPDALSISAYAAKTQSPLLLVGSDGTFTSSNAAALKANHRNSRPIIVGGENTIPASTERWLADNVATPLRLAGGYGNDYDDSRYGTSAAIAMFCFDQGMTIDGVGFATGSDYPDALAGGPMQAKANSVIVLVDDSGAFGRGSLYPLVDAARDPVTGTEHVKFFGQDTGHLKAGFRDEILAVLLG